MTQEIVDVMPEFGQAPVEDHLTLIEPEMALALRPEFTQAANLNPQVVSTLIALQNPLVLSDKEREALEAPFPLEAIEVLPDTGLLYVPWHRYRERLNQVLPGLWATIQMTEMRVEERYKKSGEVMGKVVYAQFYLRVRNALMGPEVGAGAYFTSNLQTTMADAASAARSEALRRIAQKHLNIGGNQLYDPDFVQSFVKNYMVKRQVKVQRYDGFENKVIYARRDRQVLDELLPTEVFTGKEEVEPITADQKARLGELLKVLFGDDRQAAGLDLRASCNGLFRILDFKLLTKEQADVMVTRYEERVQAKQTAEAKAAQTEAEIEDSAKKLVEQES